MDKSEDIMFMKIRQKKIQTYVLAYMRQESLLGNLEDQNSKP